MPIRPDIIQHHQRRQTERDLEQKARAFSGKKSAVDVAKGGLAGAAGATVGATALSMGSVLDTSPKKIPVVIPGFTGSGADKTKALAKALKDAGFSGKKLNTVYGQILDAVQHGKWPEKGAEEAISFIGRQGLKAHGKAMAYPAAVFGLVGAMRQLSKQRRDRKELQELMHKTSGHDFDRVGPHFRAEIEKIAFRLVKPKNAKAAMKTINTAVEQNSIMRRTGLFA